uniref:Lysophospholipid acyltransferase n=1 Tax=Bicosoecida sp. CB-2014 TaxID=1486930 RepID=A0A7S1CCL7_9STRA|mmetsp:Transcript_21746/g.76353  ORF Transcript_21746/g.76353 Transcript_21746/m.76353 type:complete len:619 (+) Transcript_21746:35-1891(+)
MARTAMATGLVLAAFALLTLYSVATAKADAEEVAVDASWTHQPWTFGGEWLADVCGADKYGALCDGFANTLKTVFKGMEKSATNFTINFHNLDGYVQALADVVGFAADELKYLLCMVLGYPLGLIYARLRRDDKHLFSLAMGLFIAQFVFGTMWVHSFITSTVVYLFLYFTKDIRALDGSRHFIVLGFCMSYMSFSHIFRVVDSYLKWELDYTGPQMLLTIKLTSLGFNFHDGTTDRARLEADAKRKPAADDDARTAKKITMRARTCQDRLEHAVDEMPSILEFFGWVYCFQNFLAGPAVDLREYLDTSSGASYGKVGSPIPAGRWPKVLKSLFFSILCLGAMVVGTAKFPIANLHNPELVNAAPWFERLPVAWVTLFFTRMKYYFAWLMVEGSAVLAGFGYTKKNKADQWSGANNVDIITFETAENVSAGSRAWNKFTQTWLERYVYRRTGDSLVWTYFTSAFWHGFYPGYYLFFMSVPLITNLGRELRRRVRPMFVRDWYERTPKQTMSKTVYDTIGRVCTSLGMNYLACAFQALAFDYAMFSWGSWYFAGHIVIIGGYILVLAIPAARAPTDGKAKKDDAPAKAANGAAAAGGDAADGNGKGGARRRGRKSSGTA